MKLGIDGVEEAAGSLYIYPISIKTDRDTPIQGVATSPAIDQNYFSDARGKSAQVVKSIDGGDLSLGPCVLDAIGGISVEWRRHIRRLRTRLRRVWLTAIIRAENVCQAEVSRIASPLIKAKTKKCASGEPCLPPQPCFWDMQVYM